MADGTMLEVVDDDEVEEEDAIQEDGGEGSRTPQPAAPAGATGAQRDPHTITSTSLPSAPAAMPARRPGRLRRASSATQCRVSRPSFSVL